MAHITGGGLYENLPRMLPNNFGAEICGNNIPKQELFKIISDHGKIETEEMFSTFNMGVGMVIAVSKSEFDVVSTYLLEIEEEFYLLGQVKKGNEGVVLCHQ